MLILGKIIFGDNIVENHFSTPLKVRISEPTKTLRAIVLHKKIKGRIKNGDKK